MKKFVHYLLSLVLTLLPVTSLNLVTPALAQDEPAPKLSEQAAEQIDKLLQDKRNRTPEQQKIDSQLLYASQQKTQQEAAQSVSGLKIGLETDDQDKVLVDIQANVTEELLHILRRVGATIESSAPEDQAIRAALPIGVLEVIARSQDVVFIAPAAIARNNTTGKAVAPLAQTLPLPALERPSFGMRSARVKKQLFATLGGANLAQNDQPQAVVTGPPYSQGDVAHRANDVRATFGADGTGVKIGVLSDTVRYLEQSQRSGNLPLDITVLPGQSGITATSQGIGEGTAMMELIYDLAPGAKLFFATGTAAGGPAGMARNIRDLRFTYGCDIIVDDIGWSGQAAFQDDTIALAVNDVTANGALYFSSAGNNGSFGEGTSTAWEGDFKEVPALYLPPSFSGYEFHDFGGGVYHNRLRTRGTFLELSWSDPLTTSANDYDLFIFDANLTIVKAFSTNFQTGRQRPFETIFIGSSSSPVVVGDRVVIAKTRGAETRALHLHGWGTQMAIATDGITLGHAGAAEAFGVAAVSVATAFGGPFTGRPSNPVESFTSSGPRRVFFNPNGTPITPGRMTFASDGGTVRLKPDIAAADATSTSVPGFTTFSGTSAAAPHAAAIAALLMSANPGIGKERVRELLVQSAMDIGPMGWDPQSGYGIVSALNGYLAAKPSPFLDLVSARLIPAEGDGDAFVEPGENGTLKIIFMNNGNAIARGAKARITSSTPGVTILQGESDYWDIYEGKSELNLNPLQFRLANNVPCGAVLNFTVTVTTTGISRSFDFPIQTGQPSSQQTRFSYTGPPVNIPDANTTGVSIRVPVRNLIGPITRVSFRIDGDNCATADGVGLQHTSVGDLTLTLVSPRGTRVTLMNSPGGLTIPAGRNFCNTLLDDAAGTSIQSIIPVGPPPLGPPYTGSFRPASPLAAFNGEDPNGDWTLVVVDRFSLDVGRVQKFSILIAGFECQRAQ